MRVLEFTLNDPSSKNAFSISEARRLASELNLKSKKKSYDAVLLRSTGSVFCSGGNLADYAGMTTAAKGKAVNREIASVLDSVASLSVPTACIVQGDCIGGGLELLAAFDYVVSVPEAQFAFWQRKIGLSFGWGGRKRLARRLSEAKIDQLALSACNLSAYEALELQLIDEISIHSQLEEKALQWLQRTALLPALPLQQLKSDRAGTLKKNSVTETKLFEKLWWNEEHKAALRKFKK